MVATVDVGTCARGHHRSSRGEDKPLATQMKTSYRNKLPRKPTKGNRRVSEATREFVTLFTRRPSGHSPRGDRCEKLNQDFRDNRGALPTVHTIICPRFSDNDVKFVWGSAYAEIGVPIFFNQVAAQIARQFTHSVNLHPLANI